MREILSRGRQEVLAIETKNLLKNMCQDEKQQQGIVTEAKMDRCKTNLFVAFKRQYVMVFNVLELDSIEMVL